MLKHNHIRKFLGIEKIIEKIQEFNGVVQTQPSLKKDSEHKNLDNTFAMKYLEFIKKKNKRHTCYTMNLSYYISLLINLKNHMIFISSKSRLFIRRRASVI